MMIIFMQLVEVTRVSCLIISENLMAALRRKQISTVKEMENTLQGKIDDANSHIFLLQIKCRLCPSTGSRASSFKWYLYVHAAWMCDIVIHSTQKAPSFLQAKLHNVPKSDSCSTCWNLLYHCRTLRKMRIFSR